MRRRALACALRGGRKRPAARISRIGIRTPGPPAISPSRLAAGGRPKVIGCRQDCESLPPLLHHTSMAARRRGIARMGGHDAQDETTVPHDGKALSRSLARRSRVRVLLLACRRTRCDTGRRGRCKCRCQRGRHRDAGRRRFAVRRQSGCGRGARLRRRARWWPWRRCERQWPRKRKWQWRRSRQRRAVRRQPLSCRDARPVVVRASRAHACCVVDGSTHQAARARHR